MMDRNEARRLAHELVSKMTLEEKASQLRYDSPAIPRLGIPAYNWWNEALHGVARAGVQRFIPPVVSGHAQALHSGRIKTKLAGSFLHGHLCNQSLGFFAGLFPVHKKIAPFRYTARPIGTCRPMTPYKSVFNDMNGFETTFNNNSIIRLLTLLVKMATVEKREKM